MRKNIAHVLTRPPGRRGWGRLLQEIFVWIRGDSSMRGFSIAMLALGLALAPMPLRAEEPPKDVKGLFLLSDYPAVSVRPGTTSTINLRLQNYALPPERLALS